MQSVRYYHVYLFRSNRSRGADEVWGLFMAGPRGSGAIGELAHHRRANEQIAILQEVKTYG
jgi:hypothetical protein